MSQFIGIPKRKRSSLRRSVPIVAALALVSVGIAYAAHRVIHNAIERTGAERYVNVLLNVPYGNFTMYAGTKPNRLALIETITEDMENNPPLHYRYMLNSGAALGTLKVTLGADEGMLDNGQPLAYLANTGLTLASAGTLRTDWGDVLYSPPIQRSILGTNHSISNSDDNERYQFYLTNEIPVSISAQFGFGESLMDWTGLQLASAYVETRASTARITMKSPNQLPMSSCKVSAGFGSFQMDGICFLNASRYEFSGGIGSYKLNFNGKLQRNLDAIVEVGLGKVAIDIPPDAGRVQIFYDDSFFSSFQFQGLNKRREGYATSVGFDQSKAPILTLRLSTGMGKMEVRYK